MAPTALADLPIIGRLLRPWLLLADLAVVSMRHENRIDLLEHRLQAMTAAAAVARADPARVHDPLTAKSSDHPTSADPL